MYMQTPTQGLTQVKLQFDFIKPQKYGYWLALAVCHWMVLMDAHIFWAQYALSWLSWLLLLSF